MSPLGAFHLFVAIVALITGTIVILRRKGTRVHRRIGWVYAVAMLLLNVSALMIYRLTGSFGPFHVAAIISLVTVAAGVLTAVRRRAGWIEQHYYWMTYSYVGLLAATASEIGTRVPNAPFWWVVVLLSLAIFAIGALLITRRAPVTLRPFLTRRDARGAR